ncbi:hypothetical protein BH09ACT5_BH09ACT5_17220 [soil metagenome]
MGYGHGGLLWGILGFIASVIGTLVLLAVAAGLIFLLVRFLLVATTAAKIYVAQNTPAAPAEPATPAETTTPATATPAAPAEPVAPPTRPVPRTRTPKAPPAV